MISSLFAVFFLPAHQVIAQDFALKILEDSPRHHESISVQSGNRQVHCFVAYPESSENATAVIVIHENRGLTDWVRSFADQLAGAGYLAIAPDLLSDFSDDIHRTNDFANSDAARDGIYQLNPEQVTADLQAVRQYISTLPSANGTTAVVGFCWGGSQSFRFATNDTSISAAMVFYGGPPQGAEDIARIQVPVYGFYGENDQRINATIEDTQGKMKAAGKVYEPVIYPGVGHAFMRQGNDPESKEVDREKFYEAFERLESILSGL